MIPARRTLLVSALLTALTGCADPARPGAVGRFGLEALHPAARAVVPSSQGAPAVIPASPGQAPTPSGALPPTAPRPAGGSGGGSAGAVVIEGTVVDASGVPVVGAIVRGEGFEAIVGETGRFVAPAGGAALTVEAPGFAAQTAGPPYQFALESLAPPPAGSAFTLTGVTDPPVAQAVVTYADASGTVTSTRTAADGSFALVVEPVGPADAAGAIAVYENFGLAGRERGVLQLAAGPRLGALSLPAPTEAGALRLVVGAASGSAALNPDLPAGVAAEEAVLSLTSDQGVNLPLVGSEGSFPASVPVFTAAGFKYSVALAAVSADESGRTIAERIGLTAGETWAPELLELPEATEAPRPGKRFKWKHKGPKGGMALFAPGQGKPAWEATTDAALPELSPGQAGFEVELQTWDGPKKAATGDRRYAVRRVPVESPPQPPPAEEPTATP